jgi:hypothetical protein
MTNRNVGSSGARKPGAQGALRPAELIGIAGVIALFVGLVTLLSTREPLLALVSAGVALIVTVIIAAVFARNVTAAEREKQAVRDDSDAVLRRHEPKPRGDDAPEGDSRP